MNDLRRKGITIMSKIPPPYEARAHEERVRVVLRKSMLSVHLIDGYSGREIEGDPGISYPQKQVALARETTGAQLIWTSRDLDLEKIEDESQREFLTWLESGDRAGAVYDFIRGTPADLVPQILEKIKRLQTTTKTNSTRQSVLLDTHVKDQLYALELSKILLKHNVQPYINPEGEDPRKGMDALEARLKEVTMLVILFGRVHENWVRQRLGAALQLSVAKNFPLKSFCVFTIPPEKRDLNFDLGTSFHVHLIDNSKSTSIEPGALTPVLQLIEKGGAA